MIIARYELPDEMIEAHKRSCRAQKEIILCLRKY